MPGTPLRDIINMEHDEALTEEVDHLDAGEDTMGDNVTDEHLNMKLLSEAQPMASQEVHAKDQLDLESTTSY